MEYKIEYCTENVYEKPVTEAVYELLVVPCENDSQKVANVKISNSLGGEIHSYKNVFGYEVLRFRAAKPFNEFRLCITAQVEKDEEIQPRWVSSLDWQEEVAILENPDFFIENSLYLMPSLYTKLSSENQQFIPKYTKNFPLTDFLIELNTHLYNFLKYDSESTSVRTTADEVLQLKSGVCQDYAHLFIAFCRYNGIPARYASGYLHQGKKFNGTAFMHAWAEAFVPGNGWLGFDPSNNLLADHLFIKVADGIDYSDCSPIRGILKTNGNKQTTEHLVTVQ